MARVGQKQLPDALLVLEDLPAALAYLDAVGRFRYVNHAAEALFGQPREQMTGKHLHDFVVPEYSAIAEQRFQLAACGVHQENRTALNGDGAASREVYVSYIPYRYPPDDVAGVICVFREAAADRFSRPVIDSLPESVQVIDRDGKILYVNRAGREMFAPDDAAAVIGKCVYPWISERDRDRFRSIHESIFEGGSAHKLEFSARTLHGMERTFEADVMALCSERGQVLGALSIARDITARKRDEWHDAFLVRLDDAIRSVSDPAEITYTAARLLCDHLGADRCSYAEISTGNANVDVLGNYSPAVPSIIGRYATPSFGPEFLSRMSAGKPYVFRDSRRELDAAAADAYEAMNIAAIIAIPILKDGRLVAGLGLHQSTPRDWHADEIRLVENVANRCWESIERGRIERALRASEEQFRTLADAIPNLAWMAHPDGNIFWYNRRWYEYTGTSPEQVEGWGWQAIHDPAVLPEVLERWRRSIENAEPFEMVFPLRGRNGEFRSFLTRIEPIRDSSGRVIRWFGTNTDITLQQEAERREKRLRQTAELLNRVAPLILTELEEETLAQRITAIATAAVGAEFGVLLRNATTAGQQRFNVYAVSDIDRQRFTGSRIGRNAALIASIFEEDVVRRSEDITRDSRYATSSPDPDSSDGGISVRSYLAVPIKSRQGNVLAALVFGHSRPGVFTDQAESMAKGIGAQAAIALDNALLFNETKRSGEALQRINEDLSRVNDDLKQFAYSASHDLREPLRMVSLYSQFLGRVLQNKLADEEKLYLEYVLKGATRMEALIRDLLSYSQSDATPEVSVLCTDAKESLRQAIANLSTVVEETKARITYGDLPRVKIAEVHLVQVFQNLLGNALKYRRAETPEVHVEAVQDGAYCVFSIADNGIGIEAQYREQIFGIFKRLHTQDEYSGTGIGLAICQRIIRRAGGRIWVDSEPGRGSTFYFTLSPVD